jgi:hypothetical protein
MVRAHVVTRRAQATALPLWPLHAFGCATLVPELLKPRPNAPVVKGARVETVRREVAAPLPGPRHGLADGPPDLAGLEPYLRREKGRRGFLLGPLEIVGD